MATTNPRAGRRAGEPAKGRGRPKDGPKKPFHVEIRLDLHDALKAEVERQRRSNRAVIEDMIDQYLQASTGSIGPFARRVV